MKAFYYVIYISHSGLEYFVFRCLVDMHPNAQASIPCGLMSLLHNDHNQTHRMYAREARTCTSFESTRAIFITRRCNNRAMTAVFGRLPLFLHLGQTFPSLVMSLNEYSSFLIVFSALQDTRTHVVVELYDTERSYVEALQILVNVSIFIDWIESDERSILRKMQFFSKPKK